MGIIGVGSRVQSGVLEAFTAAPGVEVIGVCDAYKGRVTRALERLGNKAKDYGDWRALLADKSIDAVLIATPDHWHKQQTLEALAAGKDVYLEKPMTLTIDEGPEMYRAAEKSGRTLQIGSQGMSSKLQQTAREIVQSGKLGAINLIRANYDRNSDSGAWLYPIPPDADEKSVNWEMFLGPATKRPLSLERFFRWRCYWDYSGGIATDLFVHLMTTIHYVMGATVPETVVAQGFNYRHQKTHEVPDTLSASAVYGKEQFMVALGGTFNNTGGGESGFAIMGNEGSLTFRGSRMTFTPERRREGNDWIVSAWPIAPREGLLGRSSGAEARDAEHLALADGEPGRVLERGGARRDGAARGPLRRVDPHAQAVGRRRARRPPRGRRRAHGERVDQAQGPRQLGLREGRPAEGLSCDVAAS